MLDRTFAEPRHRQTDIQFQNARVVIRIEPKDGSPIEIEVAAALGGSVHFDAEDMELRDASKMNWEASDPVATYKTRRAVVLTVSGEASVRVAK